MNIYKKIANYLIKEGCRNTTSGNWCFSRREVEEKYNIEFTDEIIEELYGELATSEEVADVVFDEDTIDIIFWTDYCGLKPKQKRKAIEEEKK